MADFNITTNPEVIPTIIARSTLIKAKAMMKLCMLSYQDFSSELSQYGQTVNVTSFSGITVTNKVPGTPIVPGGGTTSSKPITMDQHLVASVTLEDTLSMMSKPNALDNISRDMAIAIATKAESYVWTIANASINRQGAVGTAIDKGLVKNLKISLSKKLAPPAYPKYLIVGSDGYGQLLDIDEFVLASNVGDSNSPAPIVEGEIRKGLGFLTLEDQLAPEVPLTSAAGVAFIQPGLAVVSRPMTSNAMVSSVKMDTVIDPDTGLAVRVTLGYSMQDVGQIMNMDMLLGAAIMYPDWLIAVDHSI
jgi:hypothetical protein